MEIQIIHNKTHEIRGQKVMLDFDLAGLYELETRRLKEAVRRNIERFPNEFMFELTPAEFKILRSQIATSSWGGTRYPPFAFTEHGVAMLSGVLSSPKAILINIAIIKAFIALRRYALTYAELAQKIAEMEARTGKELADINEVLRWLGEENQTRYDEIQAHKTMMNCPKSGKTGRGSGFAKTPETNNAIIQASTKLHYPTPISPDFSPQ